MVNETKLAAINTTFGGVIFSLTLNEWVAVVTILYFILQMGLMIPRYKAFFKKSKKNDSKVG